MREISNRAGAKTARFPLLMPLMIFLLLLVVNLFMDIARGTSLADGFFGIEPITDNIGNNVLYGDIISILNNASELVILAIGMTLVTSASGGQDISVGAVAVVSASVFVKMIDSGDVTALKLIFAFLASCVVAMLCGAFNGTLVAVFKIQPMVATLILFTAGRSIGYAINGNASPSISDDITRKIGSFLPGVPVQTSILIVILFLIIFFLIFRFTNLRLFTEAVGINEKSARLNGLNPVAIKILTYVILGACVAVAGFMRTCKMQRLEHNGLLGGIEMDVILAVAIGGNALSGGKFNITGSVIGAYTIELLTRTLLRLKVGPEAIIAYKAIFIILLMIASSSVVKSFVSKLFDSLFKNKISTAKGEI